MDYDVTKTITTIPYKIIPHIFIELYFAVYDSNPVTTPICSELFGYIHFL